MSYVLHIFECDTVILLFAFLLQCSVGVGQCEYTQRGLLQAKCNRYTHMVANMQPQARRSGLENWDADKFARDYVRVGAQAPPEGEPSSGWMDPDSGRGLVTHLLHFC